MTPQQKLESKVDAALQARRPTTRSGSANTNPNVFKDRTGRDVDLSKWVGTDRFDMALYSINPGHKALTPGVAEAYMVAKLEDFGTSVGADLVHVRGDGSCALHAFHAHVLRLNLVETGNRAARNLADRVASKFAASARSFFADLAEIGNPEIAEVFHSGEFLNDMAIAYLAFVFNVKIRLFWIFFPKENNYDLNWQEQWIGPPDAPTIFQFAFMNNHYWLLSPFEDSRRGHHTLRG